LTKNLALRIVLAAAIASVSLWPATAFATYTDWHVYDDCQSGPGSNPFFYVDGPARFIHRSTTTNGIPEAGGGQSCTTWTYTETTWNPQYGNSAYWYLGVSPSSSGTYSFWAFEPSSYTYTKSAPYEIWQYGHPPCCSGATYVCRVNQYNDANVWHRVNDSAVATCRYASDGSLVNFSNTSTVYMCADIQGLGGTGCGGFIRLRDDDGVGGVQISFDDLLYCGPNGSNATVCPKSYYPSFGLKY
jgi:hypothetical protein